MDIGSLQSIFLGFLLSGILGAMVGIDKDIGKHKKPLLGKAPSDFQFGSIRSFALIAIFGALMAWMDYLLGTTYVFIITGLLLTAFLVGTHYTYSVFKNAEISPATEFVVLLTYFIGVMVFLGYFQISIIFAIILTFFISSKEFLESMGKRISKEELSTTLKFAAIAFVVLPLLPNQRFSIADILRNLSAGQIDPTQTIMTFEFFNPYSIWFFVVIMSGVSYLGYILTKFVGSNSSIILSSLLGGMVSSTATTASMTQKSKEDPANINSYVVGTLLASCIMFLRVFAIIFFFSFAVFTQFIIPAGAMFLSFLVVTGYFYMQSRKAKVVHIDDGKSLRSPFRIVPALQFAGLIVLIKFISGIGIVYKDIWGENIFYSALGIISGLADVDAITQTMSVDAHQGLLTISIAATTILLAVMSNNLVKGSIAWRLGEKSFGRKVMISFLISIGVGIVAISLQKILA